MNKAIKQQWVEALRSGEYKQGRNRLRSEANEFCCLGVLCNLHALANPEFARRQRDPMSYGGDMKAPPTNVVRWAGLGGSTVIWAVAERNDGAGGYSKHSFAEIADYIEKNL